MPLICVMGVSAAGKSTIGRALAEALGAAFIDADDLHPPANVAKMAAGVPLSDEDRLPWLDAVGRAFADAGADGVVIACSALRRAYRDRIRAWAPGVRFVHAQGSPELLAERAAARTDHFMPASLLDSQLATLEALDPDEPGFAVDVAAPPEAIVLTAVELLGESGE